jgi:hypothetical protein
MSQSLARLATDPSARLRVFWVLTFVLFAFNVVIFNVLGVGAPTSSSYSEESQRYQNLVLKGIFATDTELHPVRAVLTKVREVFWAIWGLLLLWTILYTPVILAAKIRDATTQSWKSISVGGKPASGTETSDSVLDSAVKEVSLRQYTFWQAVGVFAAGVANDLVRFVGTRVTPRR